MKHSNDTTNEQLNKRIAQLERKLAKLEKRVATLEAERDEARCNYVIKTQVGIIHNKGLFRYRGHYLRSDDIRDIRLGRITLEEAIANRNERWPIFRADLGLAESYELAVQS